MKRMHRRNKLPNTALGYVIKALIPYTEANLKLVFKPSQFFRDLDRISEQKYRPQTLRNAFNQAKKQGLVAFDETGNLHLTQKGRRMVTPYVPEKLDDAQLMVIFDVPENYANRRRHLRTLLRELEFTQVQKSVWTSPNDHRKYLQQEIQLLGVGKFVQVYESRRLF